MGQKINPTGFRLAVNKNWISKWYATSKNFPSVLEEDLRVRAYLKKKLHNAAVGKVVIERPAKSARITIHSARPGVVIGKKGEDIEILRRDLARMMKVPVHVDIEEIRKPETHAQVIADSIAAQLEKRVMFRRAMKRSMQNAMRMGAQGIKIMSSGRLNGIEIARTEWYREGRVPLHTLRADIDYATSEAKTTYGVIGIKVWVYKGEILKAGEMASPTAWAPPTPEADRPDRRNERKSGERRPGERKVGGKSTAGSGERQAGDAAAERKPSGDRKPAARKPVGSGTALERKSAAPRAKTADKPAAAAGDKTRKVTDTTGTRTEQAKVKKGADDASAS